VLALIERSGFIGLIATRCAPPAGIRLGCCRQFIDPECADSG
jgi:hypothetical protein